MSNMSVFDLIDAEDLGVVGGKAYALCKIKREQFSVPDGFVVAENQCGVMGEDLKFKIYESFDKLQSKFVAVRSSALGEDAENAAWAGQLDTFLNVTRENLIQNIEQCWASANSDRAVAYAKQKSLKIGNVAVLVQAMVQAEVSGVAFSVHPVTNDQQQIIIEAGFGLGEAIVSGQITPDTYVVNKDTSEILEKHISLQTKKYIQGESGKNVWEELIDNGSQKLTDKSIINVANKVKLLEIYFGYPIDVEWAVLENILYILQCRPVTTL